MELLHLSGKGWLAQCQKYPLGDGTIKYQPYCKELGHKEFCSKQSCKEMDSNEDNIAYCCRYKEGDFSKVHCCSHEEYCYDNTYDYNECLRHG